MRRLALILLSLLPLWTALPASSARLELKPCRLPDPLYHRFDRGRRGHFRLRQQLAACVVWPAAKVPASFLEPVRSAVPVLILAGENDPTTPVEWARKVAATLPASRLLVVPGGNHVFYSLEGIECIDRLTAELVERGSAEGLDLEGCRGSIKRPPFARSLE
jgi:pimeloyl-ACP methyl ester carboxylesterase